MEMKSGEYYICCNENDKKICLHKVNGWIIHDDVSKLDFGVRWVNHSVWEVTELSSGGLFSTRYNKPKNKSDIIPFIERMRHTFVLLIEIYKDNKRFKMCKNAIKKAYEEDKEIET